MDLINQIYLTVTLAELILGINQDKAFLSGNLCTTLKEGACVLLHNLIILLAYQTLLDDLLL